MVQAEGVRVAKDIFFNDPNEMDLREIHQELGPDLILKPTDQGSSVALFVLKGIDDLQSALSTLPNGELDVGAKSFWSLVYSGRLTGHGSWNR